MPRPSPHRQALRLQPLAVTRGTLAQRPDRLEIFLHHPRAFFVAPPQVRDHPSKVLAERIDSPDCAAGSAPSAARTPPRPSSSSSVSPRLRRPPRGPSRLGRAEAVEHQVAMLLGQLVEGRLGSMPYVLLKRQDRFAHQLAIALAPTARSRRRAATSIRPERSGADRSRRWPQGPGNQGTRRAAS